MAGRPYIPIRNPNAVKLSNFGFSRTDASQLGRVDMSGIVIDPNAEREREYALQKAQGTLQFVRPAPVANQTSQKEQLFDQLLDKLGVDGLAALLNDKSDKIVAVTGVGDPESEPTPVEAGESTDADVAEAIKLVQQSAPDQSNSGGGGFKLSR